jgi:hypothetical protein
MNVLAARLFLALDFKRKEVLQWGVFDLDFAIDILNVSQVVLLYLLYCAFTCFIAYVSQVVPTRANALLLQHTSAYVIIRHHSQHTSAR